MSDDLKTIWDEEHDFEEEDPGEGGEKPGDAPIPAPEAPKEDPNKVVAAPLEGGDATALEAQQAAEKKAAEEKRAAEEAAIKAQAGKEAKNLVADVEGDQADKIATAALEGKPEAPVVKSTELLNKTFEDIFADPSKSEKLTEIIKAIIAEKLGADAAAIPEPTDEFFKNSQNALLHQLLYVARFTLNGKKPNEALAEGESLTSDANMDKAIALLKEKSEASEIKEDLQKLDLEEVKKKLLAPAGVPTPETPETPKEKAGWFQDFFGKAAHGIALDLIKNVNEEKAGVNDWLNLGGIQNKLLLMVLQLCTSLGGKSWYTELGEEDKTILEKRYGLIRKEDGSLFEFGKPTDPNYMKETETPAPETPAAPTETPVKPDGGSDASQTK